MSNEDDKEKHRLLQAEELMKQVAFLQLDRWAKKWESIDELKPLIAEIARHKIEVLGSKAELAKPLTEKALLEAEAELERLRDPGLGTN